MTKEIDPSTLQRLMAVTGKAHALTDPADQAPYLTEWRGLFKGETPVVLRPGSVEEVSAILKIASETRTPIVPQGGNTGLVGGQIPRPGQGEVVLSLGRLDRLRMIDPLADVMVVEAGMTLEAAQAAAAGSGRLFPLTLASQGSCRIGGCVATNAGGTAVLSYGSMRDLVLGLEVVLADGSVFSNLSGLRKDNAGFDLSRLFIGSEGTLGIVTAAALKLFPQPAETAVALVGLADPAAALTLLGQARSAFGPGLTGFEVMIARGLDFALKHLPGARRPLSGRHDWYVLVEVSSLSPDGQARATLETLLMAAIEAGTIEDATVAASLEQGAALWALRHGMSDVQKHEGGSIKHDVSVPIGALPAFLEEAIAAVEAAFPGCRPVPFGHLGDGNIHFNVSQPVGADREAYLASWDAMNDVVHTIVRRHGGSVAAEHGVGVLKRDLLAKVKPALDIDLMHRMKAALDPLCILNPGRVIGS